MLTPIVLYNKNLQKCKTNKIKQYKLLIHKFDGYSLQDLAIYKNSYKYMKLNKCSNT